MQKDTKQIHKRQQQTKNPNKLTNSPTAGSQTSKANEQGDKHRNLPILTSSHLNYSTLACATLTMPQMESMPTPLPCDQATS